MVSQYPDIQNSLWSILVLCSISSLDKILDDSMDYSMNSNNFKYRKTLFGIVFWLFHNQKDPATHLRWNPFSHHCEAAVYPPTYASIITAVFVGKVHRQHQIVVSKSLRHILLCCLYKIDASVLDVLVVASGI